MVYYYYRPIHFARSRQQWRLLVRIAQSFALLVMLALAVHPTEVQNVVVLTKENFDKATRNKNVFIKWYDPNCDHCKQMARDWEKLGEEWKGHSLVLIAEVNCRANEDAERWCADEMEIYGVPSLLYGEPSHGGQYLQSYGDDKTYSVLTKFVNETLSVKPICSPGNVKNCDKDTWKKLKQWWKLSTVELEKAIEIKEEQMHQARQQFQLEYDRMQGQYDDTKMIHEKWRNEVKQKIKLMYHIQQLRKQRP
jgi:thioredoxin-like negative regulator of GroEL